MKRQWIWGLLGIVGLALFASVASVDASPWNLMKPFKRVEADPKKSYTLRRENGPWVILATTFKGEGAQQQAHRLVLELRKSFRVPAYIHRRKFDYSETVHGLGVDRYGKPKRMRHLNLEKIEEIAVLVGNYPSSDDPAAQKTLKKIKQIVPQSLHFDGGGKTSQSYGRLREMQRMVSSKLYKSKKGPMRRAMIMPNPLLPAGYLAPRGLDPMVVDMNKNVKHSLLKNPGQYSVRVATFRGSSTMKINKINELKRGSKLDSKLAESAEKSHRLTIALRKLGYEAYEFHDRHESVVTVGSFKSIGQPRSDGKTEIDPEVHRLIQTFAARTKNLPGLKGAVMPHIVEGIPLDAQPLPVEVPRVSIATDYARSSILR